MEKVKSKLGLDTIGITKVYNPLQAVNIVTIIIPDTFLADNCKTILLPKNIAMQLEHIKTAIIDAVLLLFGQEKKAPPRERYDQADDALSLISKGGSTTEIHAITTNPIAGLIAAAPELLEACQLAVRMLTCEDGTKPYWLGALALAISKATGKE